MKNRWELGETKDYEKFSFVEINREISESNVRKIEKSILEIGIQVPIVVNENFEIIEGQHRFIALSKNDLIIPYIISSTAVEENIASLQESRKWTAYDFCQSLAKKGDLSCKIALQYAERWYEESGRKMSKIRTLELLMDTKGSTGLITKLKNNAYSINEDTAINVMEAVNVMSGIDMGTSPFGQKIIRALKILSYDTGGLQMKSIEKMTKNNYIRAYSNESDQFEYLKSKYIKSKVSTK